MMVYLFFLPSRRLREGELILGFVTLQVPKWVVVLDKLVLSPSDLPMCFSDRSFDILNMLPGAKEVFDGRTTYI